MNVGQGKKIVFWGTGNIADACLKQFPDTRPYFYIDSNWNTTETFHGIPVSRPDDIKKWDDLFVVIAVSTAAYEEIEDVLKKKGLEKEKDYVNFRDFFGYHRKTVMENLAYINDFIHKNNIYKKSTLIITSLFTGRITDIMINFFRSYAQKKGSGKCVFFSPLGVMNEEYAEKQMGFPVFDLPQICLWSGGENENITEPDETLKHVEALSMEEREWLEYMEQRKTCSDKELAFRINTEIYFYYKKVFEMLRPKEVIIWGGWLRLCYILAEISKRNNIPFGFMEVGWIPGTFQFDRRGIAGQSEYAVCPEKILDLTVKNKAMDVKAIREYIKKVQLDNGKFRANDIDEKNFLRIDKTRKTIFFVGMGDFGLGINPQSEYWYEYVSAYFRSTQEAVLYVSKICERNKWNFVFKPHPRQVKDTEIISEDLPPNVIYIRDMKIDRLIEVSDVVVSIASAVNYKALIYGKPLVSLGHTTLQKKGCCYEPENIADIEIQLKLAVDNGMTVEQNENFELHMAQLLENYLWDDLSVRDLRYGLTLETDFFCKNDDMA